MEANLVLFIRVLRSHHHPIRHLEARKRLPVNQYKKVEKELAEGIRKWFRSVWVATVAFLRFVVQKGKQRFTVMLIPHSEKKIFNFQISLFTLVFVTFVTGVVFIGFFVLATHFTAINEQLAKVTRENQENKIALQDFQDEISGNRPKAKSFNDKLQKVIGILSDDQAKNYLSASISGSLANYAGPEGSESESIRALSDLRSYMNTIDKSLDPLDQIYKSLESVGEIFTNTPTYWPVKGGVGYITTRFGPDVHPIYKTIRIHAGLDIALGIGVPIIATANGEVSLVSFNSELGNYIQIKHKYGFSTKYAHLQRSIVSRGQKVNRGDTIGYMGATGVVSGPHVHYEVLLGTQNLDPMYFINIKPLPRNSNSGGRDVNE
jgi:murein DD-endopeptidase MepM/ murein hydrolase activator NlpD